MLNILKYSDYSHNPIVLEMQVSTVESALQQTLRKNRQLDHSMVADMELSIKDNIAGENCLWEDNSQLLWSTLTLHKVTFSWAMM